MTGNIPEKVNLFGCNLCTCRETCVGAYGSYQIKSPREDWMLRYDALTIDDAFVCVFNFCLRVCGISNHDHCVMQVKFSVIMRISILNFKVITK